MKHTIPYITFNGTTITVDDETLMDCCIHKEGLLNVSLRLTYKFDTGIGCLSVYRDYQFDKERDLYHAYDHVKDILDNAKPVVITPGERYVTTSLGFPKI
jgi:hypothetical protein